MKVIKRSGAIVDFDTDRITDAIKSAMLDVGEIDSTLCETIALEIKRENEDTYNTLGVDQIQDEIEHKLLVYNRPDVAKVFIKYRNIRDRVRHKEDSYKFLDKNFISKYKHTENPMTSFGKFVFYRTYSRWLPEEERREHWWESCRRAVEYNCSLAPTTKEEAQKLYDNMFNLKQFLSGRTLWVGGTDIVKKSKAANFNCAGEVLDELEAFYDLFYLLMLGAGIGVRVLKEDVEKLPLFRSDVRIIHKEYDPEVPILRSSNTGITFDGNQAEIVVGDSKEGWARSLLMYLEVISKSEYFNIDTLVFNYDNVRPKGERLKTFGGFASGYTTLLQMFKKVDHVIKNAPEIIEEGVSFRKLRPIDCIDICNLVGYNVSVGGVRRTAEITMIDPDDVESINMKSHLYSQSGGKWVINESIAHRTMSNNSILYKEKPTREQLHWHIERQRYSGEPGFINYEAVLKRNDTAKCVNPCVSGDTEILTDHGYVKIKDLVEKSVKIWNGFEWSLVRPRITGHNQKMKKVIVKDQHGTVNSVVCTTYHKWHLEGDKVVTTKELKVGDKLLSFVMLYGIDALIHNQEVILIEDAPSEDIVYCLTEPKRHTFIANGVITGNCGEILLDSKGMCNLTTLNVCKFVNEDGTIQMEDLLEAQRLSARAAYRMTCVRMELPKWDNVQKRDRLTGLSITGWQDFVNMTKLSMEEQASLLRKLREVAKEENRKYAKELGMNESKLVTAIKPEGTLSCLPTVSSGVHYSHSPYYIRRVRITNGDPLLNVCEELGYTINIENGETEETCTTKVIDFPLKAPAGKTKHDVSALEQLENYKLFMENYVDLNCSITISVRDHEWEEVEQWVWDNWDTVVGISFLSLSDSFYTLMPYEQVTKERYEELVYKPFNPNLLKKYERNESEIDIGSEACDTGVCPVR